MSSPNWSVTAHPRKVGAWIVSPPGMRHVDRSNIHWHRHGGRIFYVRSGNPRHLSYDTSAAAWRAAVRHAQKHAHQVTVALRQSGADYLFINSAMPHPSGRHFLTLTSPAVGNMYLTTGEMATLASDLLTYAHRHTAF